jgi:protease-4
VAERKLDRNKVLQYADGRVFTGKQAVEYGFVDTLGTLEDAIALAGEMGGIKGTPRVIRERKSKPFFERLLGESVSELAALKEQLFHQPIVQYRMVTPY